MQVRGHLAEVTFDALAADLTVPQPRPLVDLERDEYVDLEIARSPNVDARNADDARHARRGDSLPDVDDALTTRFEPVTAPFATVPPPSPPSPHRRRWWGSAHVIAAVASTALGFGLGAGIASLLS